MFSQRVRSPSTGSARDSEVLLHAPVASRKPPLGVAPAAVGNAVVLLWYWVCHEAVSWWLAALHRPFSAGAQSRSAPRGTFGGTAPLAHKTCASGLHAAGVLIGRALAKRDWPQQPAYRRQHVRSVGPVEHHSQLSRHRFGVCRAPCSACDARTGTCRTAAGRRPPVYS